MHDISKDRFSTSDEVGGRTVDARTHDAYRARYEAESLLHCGHMSSYAGRDPESAVVECLRRLRYRTAMIRSGAA